MAENPATPTRQELGLDAARELLAKAEPHITNSFDRLVRTAMVLVVDAMDDRLSREDVEKLLEVAPPAPPGVETA